MILDKRPGMKLPIPTPSQEARDTALAIVLEGVSEKWQMNVLQIRGRPTRIKVILDGYGTVDASAISLSPTQARHLAAQITELLGRERSLG